MPRYKRFDDLAHTLTSAIQSLEEGVFIINSEMRVVLLNEKAATIAREAYGVEIGAGDHMVRSFPPARRQDLAHFFNRVLEGETIRYEVEANKTGIWLDCFYTPLKNSCGAIEGICAKVRNITTEKSLAAARAAQKELADQNEQQRALFAAFMQNSPLVGWIADKNGRLQYMNPTYLQAYGFTKVDMGKSVFDLFPPQLAVDFHRNNTEVLRNNKSLETIEQAVLPGGREQIARIYKFPIRIGSETMVAGWAVDVTEQLKQQQVLQASLERYYYVTEATSDAIYDWNIRQNKIYRGNGFYSLFGYMEQTSSLRERLYNIHPEDRECVKETYFGALRDSSAEGWELQFRFRCADGTYKHVNDKALIKRVNDQAERVIGTLQDVTGHMQLQERLVQQEKTTKREVVRSIIESQEKERRKLSVELHDNVNQMLASCKLMLEVACDGGSNALELTQKSFRSLSQIINEIRKISHDLNPSALEDVGLVEAINEMVGGINATNKLAIGFEHHGWRGKEDIRHEDRISIYRLVQEQINNILKHAKATDASIVLKKRKKEVSLVIKDNGVGFDTKKLKKGLGLKNIQNRVDYYKGTLKISSAAGKGTETDIRLTLDL